MEKKTIGGFLAALRRTSGMTQKELGERVGVSDKAVSRWERDECAPDLTLIPVLAEIFETYCDIGFDLVLSGHAHGGQIRLPIIGGILAPNQGFFPKYDDGLVQQDGTVLIISRGLGNSSFPLRVNNPPELVVVTLEAK